MGHGRDGDVGHGRDGDAGQCKQVNVASAECCVNEVRKTRAVRAEGLGLDTFAVRARVRVM